MAVLGLVCMALTPAGVALARNPAGGTKVVRYHGLVLRVPRAWPVFNVTKAPRTCVRFDRHAVYLGTPSSQERCPGHAVGRTEAILLAPVRATVAGPRGGPSSSSLPAGALATSYVTRGVEVTATWSRAPGLVAAALGRKALTSGSEPRAHAALARPAQSSGAVYTGLGFDACQAPSSTQMAHWSASPYRAIGIYIGGENSACSQPNLTAAWVGAQVAAGWHPIPTFVGLQASGACGGCASIKPAQAAAEGVADANTAVADAQALGIAPGSPIYDDMENYSRSGNTSAVLAYLSAWTTQLHAVGYVSGVYSSGSSGITDLAAKWGTGYVEPDDVWIAAWNGVQNTNSSYVPAADWSNHQRVHQYQGGHNETYAGTTINIDGDYVDGATVGGPPPPPPPAPSLSVSPTSSGITNLHPSWPREPGIAFWEVLAGAGPSSMTPVGAWAAPHSQIALRGTSPYFTVQALSSSGQVLGTAPLASTPPHLTVIGSGAYVSATTGAGSLPAGCYIGAACGVVTTIRAGRTVIARTGSQSFQPGSAGVVRFELFGRGRRMLARARGGRLAVTARLRDASGRATSMNLTLIAYTANEPVSTRQFRSSPTVRIVALSDFVSARGVVGILAGCRTAAPCRVTTTLSVGSTVIAAPHTGTVGAHELGYLSFQLTSKGRAMLARARGTLAAHVALSDSAGDPATARIALVQLG